MGRLESHGYKGWWPMLAHRRKHLDGAGGQSQGPGDCHQGRRDIRNYGTNSGKVICMK